MDEAHLTKLAEALVRLESVEKGILEVKRLHENDDDGKRLASLERSQDKMSHTLEQINKTLTKFETHIDELFDVKAKLESIDTAWRKLDTMQIAISSMDKILSVLASEHQQCKPKVDGIESCKISIEHRLGQIEKTLGTAGAFVQGRVASLTDKLIWVGFGAIAAVAVFLAMQGAK